MKVTHFPVIHARQGSVGYKLEWNGLTMIYTSDTKPEKVSVRQAENDGKGVDVFIREMVVPPEIWAMQAHFPTSDDTVFCAMNSLGHDVDPAWLGEIGDKVTWSFDRMVISAYAQSREIVQRRGEVLDFGASLIVRLDADDLAPAKYADENGDGDPYAQIDPGEAYEPGTGTYCDTGY